MSITINGNPLAVLNGADDQSILPLIPQPVGTPIHLPYMHTLAKKGPINVALLSGGDTLLRTYGRDVVSLRGDYTTINTPYLELFNRLANSIMLQRVVAPTAARAGLRICVEYVYGKYTANVLNYDGTPVLNDGLEPETEEKTGLQVRWFTKPLTDQSNDGDAPILRDNVANGVGTANPAALSDRQLTTLDGTISTIAAIFDIPSSFFGAHGNNVGIRFDCPNAKSSVPVNTAMVEEIGARLYNFTLFERDTATASPIVENTLDGANSVLFALKTSAYYKPTRRELGYTDVLLPAYRKLDPTPGMHPEYSLIEDFYIYSENLAALQSSMFHATFNSAADPLLDWDNVGPTWPATNPMPTADTLADFDIFTCKDVNGNNYANISLNKDISEMFTSANIHYLVGGSDGEPVKVLPGMNVLASKNMANNLLLDELVFDEMNNFGDGAVHLLDYAKYPCSQVWDTGFSVDTKEVLLNAMGRRQNMHVVLSTHIFDQPQNDIATENSLRIALKSIARVYPESFMFGTPACRASVVGHSGTIKDSQYKDLVPGHFDLASMTAKYAGAGIGKLKNSFRFDHGELAQIKLLHGLNLTYKPVDSYSSDWEAGLVNIRSYDMYSYYYPALYTVYEEDRSILNSYHIVLILGDLQLVVSQVHRELTGSLEPDDIIIKEIQNRIIAKTAGKYDNLVTINPVAYITERDKSNGFSISCDVYLGGNVMKTVHKYTVIAQRMGVVA